MFYNIVFFFPLTPFLNRNNKGSKYYEEPVVFIGIRQESKQSKLKEQSLKLNEPLLENNNTIDVIIQFVNGVRG